MEFQLTPELLAGIVGAVISVLFSYVPKLNIWFAQMEEEVKRLIMLGLMVVTALVIYFGSCQGWFMAGISCDQAGILRIASVLLTAIIANQSVFKISPQLDAVKYSKPLEIAFIPEMAVEPTP